MSKDDLISREALKKAFEAWKNMDDYYHDTDCDDIPLSEAYDLIDNAPTVEQPTGEWIPVKYRPLTVDETIALAEYYGIGYSDARDEKAFDCPMPEDGQEILISTAWGVRADVACNDMDGEGFFCCGLENNGDWDGVDAWMPMPEPYKKGGEEE